MRIVSTADQRQRPKEPRIAVWIILTFKRPRISESGPKSREQPFGSSTLFQILLHQGQGAVVFAQPMRRNFLYGFCLQKRLGRWWGPTLIEFRVLGLRDDRHKACKPFEMRPLNIIRAQETMCSGPMGRPTKWKMENNSDKALEHTFEA